MAVIEAEKAKLPLHFLPDTHSGEHFSHPKRAVPSRVQPAFFSPPVTDGDSLIAQFADWSS